MLLKIKAVIWLFCIVALAIGLEVLAWTIWKTRWVLQGDTMSLVFVSIFSILGLMIGGLLICSIWKPEMFDDFDNEGDSSVALNTTLAAVQSSSAATMSSITSIT